MFYNADGVRMSFVGSQFQEVTSGVSAGAGYQIAWLLWFI